VPVSTRKHASLFHRALNVGFVWARITAVNTRKPPKNDKKLKIESADKIRHRRINIERAKVRHRLNFLIFCVVTKTYPKATIMTKLGRYTPKKKSVASCWLMLMRIRKSGGLNKVYTPKVMPMKIPSSTIKPPILRTLKIFCSVSLSSKTIKVFSSRETYKFVVYKMERAYREDELLDSLVVDSEGYIYGKVGKTNIDEDKIVFLVYETKPDERTVVDTSNIKEDLLKRVKLPFTAKLQRLSSHEVLAQNIQKEFGLNPEESPTDQHYIKYAENLGIEIPYRKVTEDRKESKGTVTLREVKTIKISAIGTGEKSSVIKVILLHEPKEAKFRKIQVQKTVPYRSTKIIGDKFVLDADGLAVGYVDSVVLFSNTPGIRIYSSKRTDSVALSWLFKHFETIGRPDIIEAIGKYFGMEKGVHVHSLRMEDLEDFMSKTKFNFKVPEDVLLKRGVKEFVMDIPWDLIHKIGDVVLLGLTLSELRTKGY